MNKTLFVTHAIDCQKDKGQCIRDEFKPLIEATGWNLTGAGFGENPIIDLNCSKGAKKIIITNNLIEQKNSHATLVITDLETFAVGTWIELYLAHTLNHHIILFITNPEKEIKNIYLTALVDKIIYSKEELTNYLIDL